MNIRNILVAVVALFAVQAAVAGGPLDKKPVKKVTTKKGETKSNFDKAVDFFFEEKYDEAYTIFKKELNNPKHKGYAATYIASMMIDADEVEAATEAINQAQESLPTHDTAFCAFFHGEAARLMQADGNDAAALDHLNKAIDLAPDDAFYYGRRGKLLHKLERYDEAVVDLAKAAKMNPDDMDAQISLGCTLDAQTKFDEALEIFNAVVKKWPKAANSYAYRASTYYNTQDFAAATDDAIRAIELDGENEHALWLLPYIKAQDATVVAEKLKAKRSSIPAKWDAIIATLE